MHRGLSMMEASVGDCMRVAVNGRRQRQSDTPYTPLLEPGATYLTDANQPNARRSATGFQPRL